MTDTAEDETEPADANPGEGDGAETEGRRNQAQTLNRPLLVLAAVFLVGTIALAVVAVSLKSKLDEERGGRKQVEELSSTFSGRLVTLDHTKLEESKTGVLELSTGKFKNEYEQAYPGLAELYTTAKATQEGTPIEVYVSEVEDDSAKSIVILNTVTNSPAGTSRRFATFVQLTMVKVGGKWKVDGVTNLNVGQTPPAAGGGAANPGGAPSTPTSAPR